MGANGFREDELVSRKVKVGNEWQTRVFPIIGGRLRIIHEMNDRLSITTEIIRLEPDFAVVRATLESEKGKFCGTGTASAQRDARLADSLVELAETRAIARSLRFGGIGCEFTSAEEVTHAAAAEEPEREQTSQRQKLAQRCANYGADQAVDKSAEGNGSKRQDCPIDRPAEDNGLVPQNCGNSKATTAQVRALFALTKRAHYSEEDVASLLAPLNASTFQELTRESASQLITSLQQEVAA